MILGHAAAVRQQVLSDGWVRLAGLVPADRCKTLRQRGPGHEWRAMATEVGVVRQEGWYCQPPVDELPAPVVAAAAELAADVVEVFAGLDGVPAAFNEITWQRQTTDVGFIGPHRDQSFYAGVVAVITLVGRGRFDVLAARDPEAVVASWEAGPGDLVLLRGGGLGHPGARCPWHQVARPTAERETLTFRHTTRAPGGWE